MGSSAAGVKMSTRNLSDWEAMAGWILPSRNLGEIFTKYSVGTMLQGENVLITFHDKKL